MLDDIAAKLETAGIGTVATDIFKGGMPDAPDNCICLYEYAGSPPTLTHDGKEIEKPGLQAKVRNVSYPAGRAKIESVIKALNKTANTTTYLFIRVNQSPYCLGRDENRRWEWIVNFSVSKKRL